MQLNVPYSGVDVTLASDNGKHQIGTPQYGGERSIQWIVSKLLSNGWFMIIALVYSKGAYPEWTLNT